MKESRHANHPIEKKLVSKLILGLALPLALFSGVVGQPQTAAADAEESFLHPGMIFTQADLDRMKQQVAAKQLRKFTNGTICKRIRQLL